MKKRILSLILLVALLFTAVPLQAQAANPRIPIYIGFAEVDYMAEEILKDIPTAGLDSRQQIQAVYDWIIANCSRTEGSGETFFDEKEVTAKSHGAFMEDLIKKTENGQILTRLDLKTTSGTPTDPDVSIEYDSTQYVAQFAYDIMLTHFGNCAHFSALLTVLLGHLGFDCRMIHGEFINLDGTAREHVWNYVLLDGSYVWADIRMDHQMGGHNYFLVDDTEAWAREHTWNHAYSDWLKEQESAIAEELRIAADVGNGPWGFCSDWAAAYMEKAGNAGLIPSRLDYQDLTRNITRAEFAAVALNLYEALKQTVPAFQGESPFTDTSDPDVLRAYSLGVVNGMGDGTFAPDANLTREQAVTMLGRVYELAETNAITDGSTLEQGDQAFSDNGEIFDYARQYVYFFAGKQIVDGMGDGTFCPKLPMTREQAIKVAGETAAQFS